MKRIKFIYTCLFCLVISCFTSCQLTKDIEDYQSLYTLNAFNAIVDEASAELALVGAYSGFRQRSIAQGLPELFMIPSALSGLATSEDLSNIETKGYLDNNPTSREAKVNLGAYTRMYDLVNRCNWLIKGLSDLDSSKFKNSKRHAEILGEAKGLRATANFYLFRLWGEFYDVKSEYGINIRTTPVLSSKAFPRNSVAETYDIIIEDLDDAIIKSPDFKSKLGISKTYAKALKSKVLLYKGEYKQAATLAQDVIKNSGSNFALAPTYAEIFKSDSKETFNSSEYLFITGGTPEANIGIQNFWGFYLSPSSAFFSTVSAGVLDVGGQKISYDSDRVSSMFNDKDGNLKFKAPYPKIYHLRMAEVYLIFAEANARANKKVTTEALETLNAVRIRARTTPGTGNGFKTYPASISFSQFIDAVRIEKMVELACECGEEWFDLVRYHFVDGFDITTVKLTAKDPEKYILPIDFKSIEAGGKVIKQNPGY